MNQSQQIAARPSGLPCQIDLLAAAYPSPSRVASVVFARLVSSSWPAFCCLQVPSRVASFVFAVLSRPLGVPATTPPYSVPCCLSRPSVNLACSVLFCLISFILSRSPGYANHCFSFMSVLFCSVLTLRLPRSVCPKAAASKSLER